MSKEPTIYNVAPAPYVTLQMAAAMTGYSPKAIQRKIEEGVWLEGRVVVKAPDGRWLVSMEAYKRWAEGRA